MVHAARHSNALNDQKLFKGNREPSAKNNAAKINSQEWLACIRERASQLAQRQEWLLTRTPQEQELGSLLQDEDSLEREVMRLLSEDEEPDEEERRTRPSTPKPDTIASPLAFQVSGWEACLVLSLRELVRASVLAESLRSDQSPSEEK